MAQTAKVSPSEDGPQVEVTHPTPETAEEFVSEGMCSDVESVLTLAAQQWRIKAQTAARNQMADAHENGASEETLQEIAQRTFDRYTYGGRRQRSVNLIDAEELIQGDTPTDQERAILEKLDAQDENRVIWGELK